MEATGDIWSTGAFSFESPLKDLLDRGEYTLEELLGEDELLQELRGMHPQLIQFFSTERAVVGLVKYVIGAVEPEKEVITNGRTSPEVEAPEDEVPENEEKKPGQWLFPPMEKAPPPSKSMQSEEELRTIRYPYMACEVICCEIDSIIDILVDGHYSDETDEHKHEPVVHQDESDVGDVAVEVTAATKEESSILDLLFSLLSHDKVDDYRAGYLDKILGVLQRKRPKTISSYINDGGDALMSSMMKHLYSHSIMQIVQRLLLPPPALTVKDEDDSGDDDYEEDVMFYCNWSERPQAIELLRDNLFSDNLNTSQNASEVLITVIQNSPLTSPTVISLTTDPILSRIIKASYELEGDFSSHDSALTCAMNVLESLILQLGGYGSVGTPEDHDELLMANPDTLIRYLPELLRELCGLLRHSCTKTWSSPMQFSRGEPQPLLGMSRLRIVRLVESLVLLGNSEVDALLCESDCLAICLDLFWEFQWCSMLHQSVANLLVHVFEGANERVSLQEYFLVKCNLLGRLMDSFEEDVSEENLLSDAVIALQRLHNKDDRAMSVESTRGSSLGSIGAEFGDQDVIPVSDDDVDAALEQQEEAKTEEETTEDDDGVSNAPELTEEIVKDASNEDAKSSIPSLRMGCLGHVIIICQALVHACTNEGHDEEAQSEEEEDENDTAAETFTVDLAEGSPAEGAAGKEVTEADFEEDEDKSEPPPLPAEEKDESHAKEPDEDAKFETEAPDSQEPVTNDLIIAQLINEHPLHDRWNAFITTTLASETAIQSTPLGGPNTVAVDPMQSQVMGMNVARSARTYDFNDEDGEEGAGGSARGFLGGEVLDMDDNDLDIAASMMEALTLSRPRGDHAVGDRPGGSAGDSSDLRQDAAVSSFGTVIPPSGATTGDYIFDDPLGGTSRFNAFGQDDSDEEDEPADGGTGDGDGGGIPTIAEPDDEDEAPVMDLFTGNFDNQTASRETSGSSGGQENGTWSNFANFDDAFAAASSADATIFRSGSSDEEDVVQATPEVGSEACDAVDDEKNAEDLFGSAPHALLLGDEETEDKQQPEEAEDKEQPEEAEDENTDSSDVPQVGEAEASSVVKEEEEDPAAEAPAEAELVGNEQTLESAVG